MTLQTLTYYVTLVETGSFTKAAKACFVTQPALSRAISDLENELKRTLLVRTAKGVTVTHAGQVCYEEAKHLLRQSALLIEHVQGDTDNARGEIHLGYLFNGSITCLSQAMKDFLEIYPRVSFETSYEDFNDAKRKLETGELDLGLMSEATATALQEVESQVVVEGGLYLVIPQTHSCYEKKTVTLAELSQERFIMWDPDELPGLYEQTMAAFRNLGVEPKVEAYGKKLGDAVAFALSRGGLGVTTYAARKFNADAVRICPAVDVPNGFGISMVRSKHNFNPFAEKFFKHTKMVYSGQS